MSPRVLAAFAVLSASLCLGACAASGSSERASNATSAGTSTADSRIEASRIESGATPDGGSLVPVPSVTDVEPAGSGDAPVAALHLRDFLPHIRLDAAARVVEFDGVVPIDAHDERAPYVYLEVLACVRDTREHESVVVTDAKPSQVHAALLAIGLEPGKPGSFSWQGEQVREIAPTGPRVRVEVIVGESAATPLSDWALNVRTNQTLTEALAAAGHAMVFAGSITIERDGRSSYFGDSAGTLVGLATFGTETIACEMLFNHESVIEEPVWIANAARMPKAGTAVRVRITAE